MITVYHIDSLRDASFFKAPEAHSISKQTTDARWVWNAILDQRYAPVAKVASDDLDEAYELTQNVQGDWTDPDVLVEDKVEALVDRARSTSVGDVVSIDDKRWFVVAPVGFAEITP